MEPKLGTFHDAITGETIVRELTIQELQQLENIEETPDPPE
jgi:hypothetical protein